MGDDAAMAVCGLAEFDAETVSGFSCDRRLTRHNE